MISSGKEKFGLFPEIIFIDTLFGSKNENRPLLIMAGKDSHGKIFIFIQAFMTNKKGWIFRYIFSHILQRLCGLTALSLTQVVITDGDAQEYGQLDNAITTHFPQVHRVRCGWHIIDRSWETHFIKKKTFSTGSQGLLPWHQKRYSNMDDV